MKNFVWLVLPVLTVAACAQHSTRSAGMKTSCADLAKLTLPETKITLAQEVAAGAYAPSNAAQLSPAEAALYKQLPAFCRVTAELSPSSDSDIKMEVWLPASGWNGKFRGQGNGGFAGVIEYRGLALAVSKGYASGGTDTGHVAEGIDASWALNHPEKIIDFGNRGVHEMTEKSKAIAAAYYGTAPKKAYFLSCSDGGREALMEAQRFPSDYDGILAGAPANNWSHLLVNAIHNSQALTLNPDSWIPPAKLPAISAAVLAACDKSDGVKDGIVSDPQSCHFDPATLICKAADNDTCLTPPQIAAMKIIYAGTSDSAGKLVFPGYLPGSEEGPNGWGSWIFGPAPNQSAMYLFGSGFYKNMVYSNPTWDYKTFEVDKDLKAAVDKTSAALDSTNPDLKPFIKHGGKLILYHGWNDPAISSLNTIGYYEQVLKTTGESKTKASVRLYMAPGVQHCGGGPGADSFGQYGWTPESPFDDPQHSMNAALEQWVESKQAPETIIATKFEGQGSARQASMTRPLCPYPQAAKYKGSGEPTKAENFSCVAPSK